MKRVSFLLALGLWRTCILIGASCCMPAIFALVGYFLKCRWCKQVGSPYSSVSTCLPVICSSVPFKLMQQWGSNTSASTICYHLPLADWFMLQMYECVAEKAATKFVLDHHLLIGSIWFLISTPKKRKMGKKRRYYQMAVVSSVCLSWGWGGPHSGMHYVGFLSCFLCLLVPLSPPMDKMFRFHALDFNDRWVPVSFNHLQD